jgi:glycosyltransferase involved in cell wall biosynthesis
LGLLGLWAKHGYFLKQMKILHLTYNDFGGAGRAALRIHQALFKAGVDSRMKVGRSSIEDWTVHGPSTNLERGLALLRPHLTSPICKALKTGNSSLHSPQVLPSNCVKRINDSDADVVNLHWVQGEMLSVADIGRIQKPVVWTLHDMWAFCGAEHYTGEDRWREGYHRNNRPAYERGFDLNRWTWKRKLKHWKRPIQIITPSRWLADCAKESALLRDWPVSIIPYTIDTDVWQPIDKHLSRELLGLPTDATLLLFGAEGGIIDHRKGYDLLLKAISYLRDDFSAKNLELVVFGQFQPQHFPNLGFPIHFTGHLYDNLSLRALYSAADVFALPSRIDNLPVTCMEAISCGTPVVAFNYSGPPSMIEHQSNGFLAKAFDEEDFASGIRWIVNQDVEEIRKVVRNYAVKRFSHSPVVEQYIKLYNSVLG